MARWRNARNGVATVLLRYRILLDIGKLGVELVWNVSLKVVLVCTLIVTDQLTFTIVYVCMQ